MIVDVLLGLLCCKTNDRMSVFLLPAVVHAKKEEEERLWWIAVSRVAKEDLLYEEAFYGLRRRNGK